MQADTTLKWATAGATGGTADSTSLRVATAQADTTLQWATGVATGGTADATSLRASALTADTIGATTSVAWATGVATGGTAAAGALAVGGSVTATGHIKTTAGTLYIGDRIQAYAASSGDWASNTRTFQTGDIFWNGGPGDTEAVGWICTTSGTIGADGTTVVFMGFGTAYIA